MHPLHLADLHLHVDGLFFHSFSMGTLPCVSWADLGVYDVHRTFAITLAGFMMRLSRIHWSTLTRSVCKSCTGQSLGLPFLAYGLTAFLYSWVSCRFCVKRFESRRAPQCLLWFDWYPCHPFSICKQFPNCKDYSKAWLVARALIVISWFIKFITIDETAVLSNSICGLSG